MTVYLKDPSGNLWNLAVNSSGQLIYTEIAEAPPTIGTPAPVYLTDPSGAYWSLSITSTGQLTYTKGVSPGPPVVGGYSSMATIMDLVRVYLNDWLAGATGTPGEGQITTNDSPQVLPTFNSALRELYRQLRNVGSPSLIRDNVMVNLPANGAFGPGVQTNLSAQGYFDGQTQFNTPTLPPDMIAPLELWEQQTGSGLAFTPMCQPQAGIPSSQLQGSKLTYWEWRGGAAFIPGNGGGDALWFFGSNTPTTIRLRYLAALSQFTLPLNFQTTFIPILDCEDVLAYKIAYKISSAISGITPPVAALKQNADAALADLRNEIVRRAQEVDYARPSYTPQPSGYIWAIS